MDKSKVVIIKSFPTAGEALISVVGEAMGIQPGEELRLTGRYVSHPTYGTQFKAAVIERTIPATSGAILKYLSGGAIRGIGPALARRIVDAFGDDTLTIMEKEPQRLAEVRGITPKKAAEIAEEYARIFGAPMPPVRSKRTPISSVPGTSASPLRRRMRSPGSWDLPRTAPNGSAGESCMCCGTIPATDTAVCPMKSW